MAAHTATGSPTVTRQANPAAIAKGENGTQ